MTLTPRARAAVELFRRAVVHNDRGERRGAAVRRLEIAERGQLRLRRRLDDAAALLDVAVRQDVEQGRARQRAVRGDAAEVRDAVFSRVYGDCMVALKTPSLVGCMETVWWH